LISRASIAAAAAVAFGALSVGAAPARAAATILVDNVDPTGQGLNDPTAFTPIGGNNAATLGAARLAVFQQAAALWGAQLASAVPIRVRAQFAALFCNSTSAVLASTGANTIHRNFPNAPVPDTWYPQALANALSGTDLDSTTDDILTTFNSGLGGASCLSNTTWYLGFDGHPGSGQIDMLTTLLHELAHGLGFQTFEDPSSGAEFNGFPDVYLRGISEQNASPPALTDMTDAQRSAANVSDPNLYWSGASVQSAASMFTAGLISGHVRLYAPSTIQAGSSVSHFSTALTPNELMEPVYTGPNHNLTVTMDLLRDLGWPTSVVAQAVPDLPGPWPWTLVLSLTLAGAAARRLRRVSSRCNR
jgi:hypothetical protein